MEKRAKIILSVVLVTLLIATVFSIMINSRENYEVFTAEVISEYDDGRTFIAENSEKGYGDEYEAWAFLQLSPSYSFGIRFINVTIPQGAKIKKAYVKLFSVGTPGHNFPNCKIYCDDTDNAVNFSILGVLDICGRNYTSNYTRWNTTVPYGVWVKTPSLVSPIQEVINRPNWTFGNALAILFVSEGLKGYSAAFENYGYGHPAKLYIEWEKV